MRNCHIKLTWKFFVTMNVQAQLKATVTEAARLLILEGKISPSMSHGTGPNPKLKATTKTTKATSGSQPKDRIVTSISGDAVCFT